MLYIYIYIPRRLLSSFRRQEFKIPLVSRRMGTIISAKGIGKKNK